MLASASPRRAELLTAAGFLFDVDAAHIDERLLPTESPEAHVARLAREKAEAVALRHRDQPVLGADTVVVLGEDVLGKPRDEADATRMLRRLSGQSHEVLTAVALAWHGAVHTRMARTTVWMNALSDDDISSYVASGEPMDKAGAYAIQGLASRFITKIDGSYTNVVGLPVAIVSELLRRARVRNSHELS